MEAGGVGIWWIYCGWDWEVMGGDLGQYRSVGMGILARCGSAKKKKPTENSQGGLEAWVYGGGWWWYSVGLMWIVCGINLRG